MTRLRFFQCTVLAVIIAFCVFGQPALAESPHHPQIRMVPHAQPQNPNPDANPAPPDGLYGLDQAFTAYALDGSGADEWPCFGGGSGADCSTIVAGGVVVGIPQYVWSYSACDGATASDTTPCGQTETWYEDDSNDTSTSDDLTYSLTATQVQGKATVYIADSGTVDFGPNPYGGLSPAADVIIYGDQNFGTLGQTGKNNGNCEANFNYPSPVLPGVFVIAANKTCVNPQPGLATLTATTQIATATFSTKKGVTTVKYTIKYKLQQKWNIWFQ